MSSVTSKHPMNSQPPFDTGRLDQLMEHAGLDVLLVTSPHNLRYMLGQPPLFLFAFSDAFGTSRYQPVLVYPRARSDASFYAGFAGEGEWREDSLWPASAFSSFGTGGAMHQAANHVAGLGRRLKLGIEAPYLSADALAELAIVAPGGGEPVDATALLQEFRSRKSAPEIAALRTAAERVLSSIVEVLGSLAAGMTKHEVSQALALAEVARGLDFKYCLVASGCESNRAPSRRELVAGDAVSIDSGGSYRGYLGDIARMGVIGEPDSELEELLAEVDEIQELACAAARLGAPGRLIHEAVAPTIARSSYRDRIKFDVHGLGLTGHEVPNLMNIGSSVVATDQDRALEPGMMLSIETALLHPRRGFIKLEDAVVLTDAGSERFAAGARGWHRATENVTTAVRG
jgi:Xaa-Pro aminopeptidase